MVATTWENRPEGFFSVPLNIRCSRKWASPDLPGVSSAEPTLYQIMWVTTGARWSGITTTSSPFDRVKWVICAPFGFAVATPMLSVLAATASAARLGRDPCKRALSQVKAQAALAHANSPRQRAAARRSGAGNSAAALRLPSASFSGRAVLDGQCLLLGLRAETV